MTYFALVCSALAAGLVMAWYLMGLLVPFLYLIGALCLT